ADIAVRAGHGAGLEPRQLALDVEVTHFPEVEELLVKPSPLIHVAAKYVVGDMIEAGQPAARMAKAWRRFGGHKIHVIDGMIAIAIDEINHAPADAFDRRY